MLVRCCALFKLRKVIIISHVCSAYVFTHIVDWGGDPQTRGIRGNTHKFNTNQSTFAYEHWLVLYSSYW